MVRTRIAKAACAVLLAGIPMVASAQKDDSHGHELQAHGLGQSKPSAPDLSHDPDWRVYRFERDGVSYFQVNDQAGGVHLIVGYIDGTFWTLPAGERPARVSLPMQPVALPGNALSTVVYDEPAFSIAAHGEGLNLAWSVETR